MAKKINKVLTTQAVPLTSEEVQNLGLTLSAVLERTILPTEALWIPSVTDVGILSWRLGTAGDPGPSDVNIRGAQGPQGIQGPQGAQGDKGDKGDKGDQGEQGDMGLCPQIDPVTKNWKVYENNTWIVTSESSSGAVGPQGPKGNDGPEGPQGIQGKKGDPGNGLSARSYPDQSNLGVQVEIWQKGESAPDTSFLLESGYTPSAHVEEVTAGTGGHTNGGYRVQFMLPNGGAFGDGFTLWNGNDGEMSNAPNIEGEKGLSAEFRGNQKYWVGLNTNATDDAKYCYNPSTNAWEKIEVGTGLRINPTSKKLEVDTDGTIDAGYYNFVEGHQTNVKGGSANHAEGMWTVASGEGNHAQNVGCSAIGYGINAQGLWTKFVADSGNVWWAAGAGASVEGSCNATQEVIYSGTVGQADYGPVHGGILKVIGNGHRDHPDSREAATYEWSDALVLFRDGTLWTAGRDILFGGTPDDPSYSLGSQVQETFDRLEGAIDNRLIVVSHDPSLSGEGTSGQPLGLNNAYKTAIESVSGKMNIPTLAANKDWLLNSNNGNLIWAEAETWIANRFSPVDGLSGYGDATNGKYFVGINTSAMSHDKRYGYREGFGWYMDPIQYVHQIEGTYTQGGTNYQHMNSDTLNFYKTMIHPAGTSSASSWANDNIIHIILEA